ncbi:hypothetical protein ACFORO_20345 [Amycolatopsis halotolerans]|uniref:Uncharacterized protein n=1 Tax=Amycolatopsis halotolerans TaxID=330083 RepID=A0ABV7QLS1_9PSEU
MKISFSPSPVYSPHGRERTQGEDLTSVSENDLRWYYFLGQLSISHTDVEIGPSWGWIPLFDAMCSVRNAMRSAREGSGVWKVDFTENAELITFEFDRGSLRATPTYLETTLQCSVDEFVDAGTRFIAGELQRVMLEYPALAGNQAVRALAQAVRRIASAPRIRRRQ